MYKFIISVVAALLSVTAFAAGEMPDCRKLSKEKQDEIVGKGYRPVAMRQGPVQSIIYATELGQVKVFALIPKELAAQFQHDASQDSSVTVEYSVCQIQTVPYLFVVITPVEQSVSQPL